MPDHTVVDIARDVTDSAVRVLQSGRSVLIRAHPGAGKTGGKTSGTIRLARALAGDGRRVGLLIPQNDQVVETLRRLIDTWPDLDVFFVPSSTAWRQMPEWVRLRKRRPPRLKVVRAGEHRSRLRSGEGLFVMTAAPA